MEWVFKSPQIHSTFSNLGFMYSDRYYVNENCNAALEIILNNILTEDTYLRPYRRSISVGQNVQKDLIPLMIHAEEDKTIELLVKILVNLTIPIECLLSVEVTSRSDFGLHTIFEINKLLTSTKAAFTDHRATNVIVEFLKKSVDLDQQKVTPNQCSNICNSLLLFRNVLHIPEEVNSPNPGCNNGSGHNVQNQILWNIFSQGIDHILIKLMTMPEATNWGVTLVQLIALLYKDQHAVTLHKHLNVWLDSCVSESSEDNESNTSPSNIDRDHSPPISTSDPASDSSDNGGSGKCNEEQNFENNEWGASSENNIVQNDNQPFQPSLPDENDVVMVMTNNDVSDDEHKSYSDDKMSDENSEGPKVLTANHQHPKKNDKKFVITETSDCGYGTQLEMQGSISTSSNDEDVPFKKPVHKKPHNPKQRVNTKSRSAIRLQERKRKKVVKRGKANIINVQGLLHQAPTDDDISNLMNEFTVDFLLKGYNSLVRTLHSQILTNLQLEIDTSHFFWLVTYFLRFATQIEMDLRQVSSVLSFDIVSYLTAEGVNLCEQFELAVKLGGNDLKPNSRRLHLVVTAIREFVLAIEVSKKFTHIGAHDTKALSILQYRMCETNELTSLLVLLLRYYNPKLQSKQYLQDLIVTNHILLSFVDEGMRSPEYAGSTNIIDHIKQFATSEIMYKYGLLLEDYTVNGEFTNDCVFTLMHHVGGALDSLICLYQPKIMKTFTSIWRSEYEICDDWSDLIEHVINTFIKKPTALLSIDNFRLETEIFDDEKLMTDQKKGFVTDKVESQEEEKKEKTKSAPSSTSRSSRETWTEDELSSLIWCYLQCNTLPDVVGEILKCLKEEGTTKSRTSVIKELYKQKIINKEEYEKLSKGEVKAQKHRDLTLINKQKRDIEIEELCEQLRLDGNTKCFDWIQQVLLETCFAKLQIEKRHSKCNTPMDQSRDSSHFELLKQEITNTHVMSPVSYHALLFNISVPLVPWNCEQASMCKDLNFLQLLHKLGFQMPIDTGKVFIRIPHTWSSDVLYEVAGRIGVIDTNKLKFSVSDITNCGASKRTQQCNPTFATDPKDVTALMSNSDNYYQIHKVNQLAAIVNFTPRPVLTFNTEVQNDTNKRCWLEVVQQSQELKLTCALGALENVTEDEEMLPASAPSVPIVSVPVPDVPLMLPPTDSAPFNAQLLEVEDNNSETASVASDLTRMYVSDEDEKSEHVLVPRVKVKPIIKEEHSKVRAGKRSRVHSPTF